MLSETYIENVQNEFSIPLEVLLGYVSKKIFFW